MFSDIYNIVVTIVFYRNLFELTYIKYRIDVKLLLIFCVSAFIFNRKYIYKILQVFTYFTRGMLV